MKTLISIDPGMSTGLIVGTYSDTEPFRVTHAFQIEGGLEGFTKNVSHYNDTDEFSSGGTCFSVESPTGSWSDGVCLWFGDILGQEYVEPPTVIAEKFNARGGNAKSGFSYTTKSLEALRVEGSIVTMGLEPTWVQPAQQYFVGGDSLAEKLKSRNAWLKEHKELGYYLTGETVGCEDANDARSALSHCISYLRRQKHKPTLGLFRKDEDE